MKHKSHEIDFRITLNRFLDLLAESNWSSNHPLSWLHYELLRKIRKIE